MEQNYVIVLETHTVWVKLFTNEVNDPLLTFLLFSCGTMS